MEDAIRLFPDCGVKRGTVCVYDIKTGASNARFGGKSPAEYLGGKSWDEMLEVGLEALRMHGALK